MLIIYLYKSILASINKTKVTVTVFLIAFLALHGVNGEEVHLFFTGSLNGKLEGCTCSKDPAPGLARRHAVLESLRKKYPEAIWVDTGDNVSGYNAPWQMQTILEYYTSARYHALLWGDEEMNAFQKLPECLRKKPWKNTGGKIPLLNPGLSLVDASRYGQWEEYSAFVRHRRWVSIRKNNTRIYLAGYMADNAFAYTPLSGAFREEELPVLLHRLQDARNKNDIVILVSHSGLEKDRSIASSPGAPDIIISGHDQNLFEKPLRVGKSILVGTGKNGSVIGELHLIDKKVIRYKIHFVDFTKIQPDKNVEEMVNKYKKNIENSIFTE